MKRTTHQNSDRRGNLWLNEVREGREMFVGRAAIVNSSVSTIFSRVKNGKEQGYPLFPKPKYVKTFLMEQQLFGLGITSRG